MGASSRTIFALLLTLLASTALAKTKLDVEPGYSDRYRPGRWVPVTVTVQSDQPRSGVLELRVPNASSSTMTIRQQIGISTQPQTYVLYAPLALQTDPLTVSLVDAATDKLLADWPRDDGNFNTRLGLMGEQINFALLTTGRTPALSGYRRGGITGVSLVDHLRPSRLPTTPIGLDAADVLFINDPDWSQISAEQQRAVVAWVRAGGTLLLWPGVDAVPMDMPLAEVLPATIGEPAQLAVSKAQLDAAELGKRFGTMTHRRLTAKSQAISIPLLGGETAVISGQFGLGQVAVLPIDAGVLQFHDAGGRSRFWDALFDALLPVKKVEKSEQAQYAYQSPNIAAASAGLNCIGDIPNTGAFGFGYVAALIGAMMLLVGPIDYFVLRKIGHQPWTWGTTIGWIGLITIGAIYAGHLLRSGDLHFRTLRLIEQSGDGVTSESALALVYAPRSRTYSITAGDGWWWQPVPAGNRYHTSTMGLPLDTYQSPAGNAPQRMWIEVWNWRFLQGKRIGTYKKSDVVLDAQINGDRVMLTNRSDKSIQLIGFAKGASRVANETTLAPNGSQSITLPTDSPPEEVEHPPESEQPFRSLIDVQEYFYVNPAQSTVVDAAMRRGMWVVYAEILDPVGDIAIDQPEAITQHKAYVRMVIENSPASSSQIPSDG